MQDLENLISYLKSIGVLKSKEIEEAIRKYPRHLFVPSKHSKTAYIDEPLEIGHGQTISQPSTVVIMTEELDVKKGQKVLEIGSGSGWQAALLSRLVGKEGVVYTVEMVKGIFEFAKVNIEKLAIKNVKILERDGSEGLKEYAPYDRIIITAACPDMPKNLLEQLKIGGKMVMPVGDLHAQKMLVVEKTKSGIKKRELPGYFVFVPLLGAYGFKLHER